MVGAFEDAVKGAGRKSRTVCVSAFSQRWSRKESKVVDRSARVVVRRGGSLSKSGFEEMTKKEQREGKEQRAILLRKRVFFGFVGVVIYDEMTRSAVSSQAMPTFVRSFRTSVSASEPKVQRTSSPIS